MLSIRKERYLSRTQLKDESHAVGKNLWRSGTYVTQISTSQLILVINSSDRGNSCDYWIWSAKEKGEREMSSRRESLKGGTHEGWWKVVKKPWRGVDMPCRLARTCISQSFFELVLPTWKREMCNERTQISISVNFCINSLDQRSRMEKELRYAGKKNVEQADTHVSQISIW